MQLDKRMFVVIHGAVRETIHRSPQIGTAEKETFKYREGQIGLIDPKIIKKRREFYENPFAKPGVTYLPVCDLRYGGYFDATKDDVEIIVATETTWKIPEKPDDYHIITLGENEFRIAEGSSRAEIAAHIRLTLADLYGTSKNIPSKEEILEMCFALEKVYYRFNNLIYITLEPSARHISDDDFEAAKAQCRALYELNQHIHIFRPIDHIF